MNFATDQRLSIMGELKRKINNIPEYISMIVQMDGHSVIRLFSNLLYYFYALISRDRYCERKVNDYKMLLEIKDRGISRDLLFHGTREKDNIIFLNRELKEGMVVLDLGANIGYYSILMGKAVGKKGKIYALEPSKFNFSLLNLNIKLNDLENVVETFNIGISTSTGKGKFYESGRSNWHTFYPKVHSGTRTESLVDIVPIEVPVTTIGDFQNGRRSIELIRMDIEGFEVEVLNSLRPLLRKNDFRPKILFEVHQPRYDDSEHNIRGSLENLFDEDYYVKYLASNRHEKGGEKIFRDKGYKPKEIIKTDGMKRGIFDNISNEDAIGFICDTNFVRTVLLERKPR